MKIYFEDGRLGQLNKLPEFPDLIIDAAIGITSCRKILDWAFDNSNVNTVYTNSLMGFSNIYAWNKELGVPEVYIRFGENKIFTRIDELTWRELRQTHNLRKMYIASEFRGRVETPFTLSAFK